MKLYFLVLLLATTMVACNQNKEMKSTSSFWNSEKADSLFKNRQNEASWDMNMFANDLENQFKDSQLPITNGIFPVPNYGLVGKNSFKGVGNFAYPGGEEMELKIGNKTILYNSFFVGKSIVNEQYVGDRKNEIFFQIIVLTDFVDTVNYSHLSSEVVSRNHPNYIGQGFYKTKTNQIDYLAFITADRNAYAVVNMRLFDLKQGRVILIAPQLDNSFRSMQINSPLMSSDEIESYTEELLKKKEVVSFFTFEGNI